jgi:hypothetical protein
MIANRMVYAAAAFVGFAGATAFLEGAGDTAATHALEQGRPLPRGTEAVATLHKEAGADRIVQQHGQFGASELDVRSKARRDEILNLYRDDKIGSSSDYSRAAEVLLQSSELEDILLAHDFALAALSVGDHSARWVSVAATDKIMAKLGLKQRYGTLYKKGKLYPVSPSVTDKQRRVMQLRTLKESRQLERVAKAVAPKRADTDGFVQIPAH